MEATCAHGDAHSSVVSATPISGSTGLSARTSDGNSSLVSTPSTVGTSTTWNVLMARPCAG